MDGGGGGGGGGASPAAVLSVAAQAVVQVALLALAGAGLELCGAMGKARRGAISLVAYRVLLPALLFANVSESLSLSALRTMWVMPLYAVAYTLAGAALGAGAAWLTVRDGDELSATHVFLCCSVGNYAYLPLILASAVLLQGALHGGDRDLVAEAKRGAGLISLFVPVINLWTFAAGTVLLKKAAAAQPGAQCVGAAACDTASAADDEGGGGGGGGAYDMSALGDDAPSAGPPAVLHAAAEMAAAPTAPRLLSAGRGAARDGGAAAAAAASAAAASAAAAAGPAAPPRAGGGGGSLRQRAAAIAREAAAVLSEPPIAASLGGIVVGLIAPLKALLWVDAPPVEETPPQLAAAATLLAGAASWAADLDLAGLTGVGGAPHGSALATRLTLWPDSALRLVRDAPSGGLWLCAHNDSIEGAPPGSPVPPAAAPLAVGWLCYPIAAGLTALAAGGVAGPAAAAASASMAVVAPLGPTVAAAAQTLAAAVAPMVALMMGSSIVEREEEVARDAGSGAKGRAPGALWASRGGTSGCDDREAASASAATGGGAAAPVVRL